MQVYRGMDVGTAKPGAEDRARVPHHLIDVADPSEDYSVRCFQQAAAEALADIEAGGRRALLVGGTGLYLRAVVDGLALPPQYPSVRQALEAEADRVGSPDLHRRLAEVDPDAAAKMLPTNRRRVVRALEVCVGSGRPFSSFGPGLTVYPPTPIRIVGLRWPRAALDRRIADRYDQQMGHGFLEEVAALAARPGGLSRTARQALGYRELLAHLAGECTLEAALAEAVRRTRAFARRQESWFRRDPRIVWMDPTEVAAGARSCPSNSLALLPELLGDWAR